MVSRLMLDLAMVLGVAGLTSLLFHRLRLPVMLGYVLAGMVVGPHVPIPLVADKANVQTLADLGVTLLMFSLGLEFNIQRLLRAGPSSLLMGAIQMGFAFFLGSSAAQLMGWSQMEALFTGAALCASSTMVIAKVFEEQPPAREVRETVISLSIVQDLGAMMLLTALTALGRVGKVDASELGQILLRLCFFLVLMLGLGRLVVPRFIRWVCDHGRVESQIVTSVGLCFISAMGADAMGFPLALGAFLGGTLASESGRARLIEKQVLPFRDLFSAIFFVAVGMMIDPRVILPMTGPIVLLAFLIMGGNLLSTTAGGMLAGLPLRTGVHTGIALGVISELGYITMALGISLGVIRQDLYAVGVAVGLLTTFLMPFVLRYSEPLCDQLESRMPQSWKYNIELYQTWAGSLRRRGVRRGEGRLLRKPLLFLLADGLLLSTLVPAFSWLIAWSTPLLRSRFPWGGRLAPGLISAILGVMAAVLVLSILRQGRVLARDLAVLAPTHESGGIARRGRHLLAGGLRVAILLMIGLPMIAILHIFSPGGPLLLIALGVFATTIGLQFRSARRLFRETPGGTEWLLSQMQVGERREDAPAVPSRPSHFRRFVRKYTRAKEKRD